MRNIQLLAVTFSILLASCGGGDTGGSTQPVADTLPPAVALNAVRSGTTINLTASATDSSGISKVEFYRSGTLIGTDATAPYEWADTVTSANNGTLNYSARASDTVGNTATSAAQVNLNVSTLYQGVWGWAILDTNSTLIESGAVIYEDELSFEGRPAAFGVFINKAQTISGGSALGPVTAASKLETVFLKADSSGNPAGPYFAGSDSDDKFGSYEGSATFEGPGYTFVGNQPGQQIYILMIQTSTVVPQSAAKAASLKGAQSRVLGLAQQSRGPLNTLKADRSSIRSMADKVLQGR